MTTGSRGWRAPPQVFGATLTVDAERDQHCTRTNSAHLSDLLILGIDDQIGERLVQPALRKGRQAPVQSSNRLLIADLVEAEKL